MLTSLSQATLAPLMQRLPATDRQAAPSFCRGIVLAHLKETNFYLVMPSEGPFVNAAPLTAVDLSSQPVTGISSTVEQSPLAVGSPIWYLDRPFLVWDGTSRQTSCVPIIGSDNSMPAPNTATFPRWTMIPSPKKDLFYFTGSNDPVITSLVGAAGLTKPGDRSFGRPNDACDSDWLAINSFKGYVRVGADHLGMIASPSCGISVFTISDTCIINGGVVYIRDTASAREAEYPDGKGGFTRVASFAFTPGESLGSYGDVQEALDGDPENGGADLKDEESNSFWRLQEVSGPLVNGSMRSLVDRPSESGLCTNAADDIHVPAVIEHRGSDGVLQTGARHGVAITRDFGLNMARQLKDEAGISKEPTEPEEPASDPTAELEGEMLENATQYAGLMYELMKRRFVERYLKKADGEHWRGEAAKDICEKVFGITETDPPLPTLGETELCYKFSADSKDTKDPVKEGDTLKANQRGSYIWESPTGAVVLSDGHGSEIRMEGGNITITCAGDIKILPGRDLAALVPRTLSLTAQGRTEVTSSKQDVVICANKSVSVTAIKGTATVESMSVSPSSSTKIGDRVDGKIGGGVVIRSASTTAVVGKNLRLGLQNDDDKSEKGRKDPSGTMLLDAGKGSTALLGGSIFIAGERMATLTGGDGGVSTMGGNTVISGGLVGLACGTLAVGGEGSQSLKLTVPEIVAGTGIKAKELNGNGRAEANISLKGNLLVSDAVIAKITIAGTTAANRMACLNATATSGMKMKDAVEPEWNNAEGLESGVATGWKSAGSGAVKSLENSNGDSLFSAAGTRAGGVYYPTSEEYKCTDGHFWVSPRWQRLLQGGQTWVPEEIKDALEERDPQYPYPGKGGWKDRPDFVRTLKLDGDLSTMPGETNVGSLSSAWKVNATVK